MTFAGSGNAPLPAARIVPRVKVSKPRTIKGSSAALKVKVSGKGRLTLSGSGVRKATRSVSKAQTVTMNVVLSARARKTLQRKGTLKVSVRLAFTPGAGAATSAKLTLTFKANKKGATR